VLIRSELRALRADDGPQRTAQAEMHRRIGAWRDSARVRAVDEALACFAAGERLADLPALAELTTYRGAREFVDALVAELVSGLDALPLAHVAFRHTHHAGRSSLMLSRAGRVTLSLECRTPAFAAGEDPSSCVLSDIDSWDVVLAGGMAGRLIRAREESGSLTFEQDPLVLRRGDTNGRRGNREVLAIEHIASCLTLLRLQRRAEVATPARAYDLATGALIGQASGDVRESRRALMVALLGRMNRREDVPVLAGIARDADEVALRWEAVRECLGLDTATGFRLLGELARRIGDPIQPDAAALRVQLLEAHPQLAALEERPQCPV